MHRAMALILGAWCICLSISRVDEATAVEVMAASGKPFGIARITLATSAPEQGLILNTNGYRLDERQGRLFYPAVVHRRILGLVRELLGVEKGNTPSTVSVYFLFTGDAPLQVTFWTPDPQQFVIVPERNPRIHARLLQAWWQNYNARGRLQEQAGDYPPILETYLPRMLGQRLGMPAPRFNRPQVRQEYSPEETLKLVLNTEPMRIQIMERTLVGAARESQASQPLPPEIAWTPRELPQLDKQPDIEPIAQHVPAECFYIRFGSFDNYLWLKKLLENNGGSVGRMVALRGHDYRLSSRIQDQLGLKETRLAEMLGNQLISDVALIGRDTYLREGAALGILFEARNPLLQNELMKQRREAVGQFEKLGGTMSKIRLLDRDVSVASTPDNRLRSFYVSDDRYHLVANSLSIVERFLQTGQGQQPLSQSAEFLAARSRFPIDKDATVFVYMSPAFFRGLISPQYQIELRRRLRAVTDLELIQMARRVAQHEQLPHANVGDLVRSQLLPADFQQRADGSRLIEQSQGESLAEPIDSLRGARGTFLPIPDVPLELITEEEARQFAATANYHQRKWSQMDPMLVQLRRTVLDSNGRERIDVQMEADPFDRQKYGIMTALIGPATRKHIRQSSDDAVTVQCILQGNGVFMPNAEPHHLFFGIQNREVPFEAGQEPMWRILQVLRTAPAYLGAWPKMGLLDLLPLGEAPTMDAQGFSQMPFGLWRLQTDQGFSLVGTNQQVLSEASQELAVEEGPDEAQLRVHLMDVTQSKIQKWFAALDFERAQETSIGNTRLLNNISNQLGVPPAEALQVAESVLGVQLICALGGKYELRKDPDMRPYWVSSNWPEVRTQQGSTEPFASPSTAWFRGLDAQMTLGDNRMEGKAVLEIQQPVGEKPSLPFFDLFRRPKAN